MSMYHPHFPDEDTEILRVCVVQVAQQVGIRGGILSQACLSLKPVHITTNASLYKEDMSCSVTW